MEIIDREYSIDDGWFQKQSGYLHLRYQDIDFILEIEIIYSIIDSGIVLTDPNGVRF